MKLDSMILMCAAVAHLATQTVHAQQPRTSGSSNIIAGENMRSRMARYRSFATTNPAPGDRAPMFELKGLDGNTVALADLLKTKPVVIETGSCTCPVFRGKHAAIESLRSEYGDRVHFVVLYGREAHAGTGQYRDILPPTTFDERITLAERVAREVSIGIPVAIDDIDNKISLAYGGLPNSGIVVGKDGRVFFKMSWIDAAKLRDPLDALLNRNGNAGTSPPEFDTGAERPGRRRPQ